MEKYQGSFNYQAYVSEILNVANEAIISIDQTQKIMVFNKGAEEIFGFSATEIVGHPLDILLPPSKRDLHSDHIAKFAKTKTASRLMGERQEITGQRKNGEIFPAEASISKVKIDGEEIFTVVLRDISKRKQIETDREKLIYELRAINRAARDITSELVLEEVLQNIVHTVQTLLDVKYVALGVNDGRGYLVHFITAGLSPEQRAKIGPLPVGHGLLGLFLRHGQATIIDDISQHPISVGFPDHHPVMSNLLGVPILSKGKLIGAIYLADKQDKTLFTETDQDMVKRVALHAAIAIENAHLYEETQRLAILEERERFARDLHDGIIQSLYAVGLTLDMAKADTAKTHPEIGEQLGLSIKSLADVITDIRNYIFDLRPVALKDIGLKARLEGLVQELQVNTALIIETEIAPDINRYLSSTQASHIFHIAHEALSNIARHAKANNVYIKLIKKEKTVILEVKDDGIGFTPPTTLSYGHHGLSNIKARVANLGGDLAIDSKAGQGAILKLTLLIR